MPIHVNVLWIFEVVGEELEFGVEIDVCVDWILELGYGTGTELIADLVVFGVGDGVVLVQLIHTESAFLSQTVVIDDSHTASEGREVE